MPVSYYHFHPCLCTCTSYSTLVKWEHMFTFYIVCLSFLCICFSEPYICTVFVSNRNFQYNISNSNILHSELIVYSNFLTQTSKTCFQWSVHWSANLKKNSILFIYLKWNSPCQSYLPYPWQFRVNGTLSVGPLAKIRNLAQPGCESALPRLYDSPCTPHIYQVCYLGILLFHSLLSLIGWFWLVHLVFWYS